MENKKNPVELLLDDNNVDNIVLYDNEDNKEYEFEQVAIVFVDSKVYALLKPVTKMEGVNDDEALVFAIEKVDEESVLVLEEDDDVIDKAFDEYYKLLKAEGIEVTE